MAGSTDCYSLYTAKQLQTGKGSSWKKTPPETEPTCTAPIRIWTQNAPFSFSAALHLKLFGFILLFSFVLQGNCEIQNHHWNLDNEYLQSLRVPTVRLLGYEVYASCISLYILLFRTNSQMAPSCSTHLTQTVQVSPPPRVEIPKTLSCTSSEYWDPSCFCTVLCGHTSRLDNALSYRNDVNKYSTAHMARGVCQQNPSIPGYWLLRAGMFPNLFISSLCRSSLLPPLDISEIYLLPIIKINTSALPPHFPNSN